MTLQLGPALAVMVKAQMGAWTGHREVFDNYIKGTVIVHCPSWIVLLHLTKTEHPHSQFEKSDLMNYCAGLNLGPECQSSPYVIHCKS